MTKKTKFRLSRWKFFIPYLVAFFLAGFAIYFFDAGYNTISYCFAGLFILIVIVLEIIIRSKTLEIGASEVILREGIFGLRTIRAHYEDITDTGVHQNLIQRILNYGNIGINTSGTKEVEMIIRGVTRPVQAESMIRKKVHEARTKIYSAQHHLSPKS